MDVPQLDLDVSLKVKLNVWVGKLNLSYGWGFAKLRQDHLKANNKTMDVFLAENLRCEDQCLSNVSLFQNIIHTIFFQESMQAFFEWVDREFPPDPSLFEPKPWFNHKPSPIHLCPRSYSSDDDLRMEKSALILRPWMLPFRVDYGLRGCSDAEPSSDILKLAVE